jgi:hypothetical protein
MIAILTWLWWNLSVVLICTLTIGRILNIFSWIIGHVSSVPLPIYWLDYLIFWCSMFGVLYIFIIYILDTDPISWISSKDFLPFCRLYLWFVFLFSFFHWGFSNPSTTGFELKGSCLLGRHSTAHAMPLALFALLLRNRVLLCAHANLDHDPPKLGWQACAIIHSLFYWDWVSLTFLLASHHDPLDFHLSST